MAVKSFKGGGHIPHFKRFSEGKAIEQLPAPKVVVIPLSQHIGTPCQPLVKAGDRVVAGQKVGQVDAFVTASVHASVNGTVMAIEPRPHCNGSVVESVVIEADQQQCMASSSSEVDINQLSAQDIIARVKEAGVVGMGGAGFPTHVKLSPPPEKAIDTVILNGAECEPFLTADHRYMLEEAEKMLVGLRALMKAVAATQAYIGIEDNKPDAIAHLTDLTAAMDDVEVVALETKYPQGGEKQLIYAITGKEVPSGGLPMDVGVIVQNVGTAVAVAEACQGLPLIQRVVTVSGPKVSKSGNYMIKVGTSLEHVLKQCGVDDLEGAKVIVGGPMTGMAQSDLNATVTKTTSGIVVFPAEMINTKLDFEHCIRCGQCVDQCPMYLYPNEISIYAEVENYPQTDRFDVLDCIECGLCSYVCPSYRPIVQQIKIAKSKVWALKENKG